MDIADHVGLSEAALTRLRHFTARQCTLHDVVRDTLALSPPRIVADVVVQDEYTHDVVLPWDGNVWLVYDTS